MEEVGLLLPYLIKRSFLDIMKPSVRSLHRYMPLDKKVPSKLT